MLRSFLWVSVFVICILMFGYGAAHVSGGDQPTKHETSGSDSASSRLAGLRWMQGTWVRTQGSDFIEESWSAPEADCMIGMFRWIKDGKLWMTELMTITVDDGELVFRLRHFDRKQTPWEDKDAALTYPLKSIGSREVVFENPEKDKPRQFIFRSPDLDTYEVLLAPPEESHAQPKGFIFHRKKR